MIDPKELRIGNYFIEEDGCIAQLNGFKPFDHKVRCDDEEGCELLIDTWEADGTPNVGCYTDSTKSRPIELTPEWLDKFGFGWNDGANEYGTYRNNFVELYEHDEDAGVFHFSNGLFRGKKVEIKHVHQLQNLYYALTGEELTIKSFNQSN